MRIELEEAVEGELTPIVLLLVRVAALMNGFIRFALEIMLGNLNLELYKMLSLTLIKLSLSKSAISRITIIVKLLDIINKIH